MNYNQPPQQPGQPWQPQSNQWPPMQGSLQPWPPQQPPPPPAQWSTQPQWQQPGQSWPPQPPMQPPPRRRRPRLWLWIIGTIVVLVTLRTIVNTSSSGSATSTNMTTTAPAATSAQTIATKPAPTPAPVVIHYPPKTVGDLHGLAQRGNASAIHEFHSESVGLTGVCPQPKREVTVDSGLSEQQIAEDLLAYFYGQGLDSPCGSVVFAYHNQSEGGNAYTAGRVFFDVTDASGQENTDPNATDGLKHTLTLDVGGDIDANSKEYVVTY